MDIPIPTARDFSSVFRNLQMPSPTPVADLDTITLTEHPQLSPGPSTSRAPARNP